jgi:hypothetical protein
VEQEDKQFLHCGSREKCKRISRKLQVFSSFIIKVMKYDEKFLLGIGQKLENGQLSNENWIVVLRL